MIELHYAPIDLGGKDIPLYKFETFKELIDFVEVKTFGRRGEYVLLVGSNELDQIIIDESGVWIRQNILPLFSACKVLFIQEYRSYEEAYKVALMMKEISPLCYEPEN